jgi:fructokinase
LPFHQSGGKLAVMRIGIDLGGTKIEGVALDLVGDELARLRVPTPRSYTITLETLVRLVHDLEAAAGDRGTVGIGIPGAVSPVTGLVKNANSVWLIGQPLISDLEERLGRPVRVMNDADCFALSEASDGAAAGAASVFGVILGTGVGGGIVINGHCLQGPNLIAGEWGHNPLPWPTDAEYLGPPCYCGKQGCIETWLSGPGFEREYAAASGTTRTAREIVEAAARGEREASAALSRYHDRLARALASVINVLDPHVIVLGGGMSNTPGLAETVQPLLSRWVFSDRVETRVVRHVHGDSSGVRGAAWLWPNVHTW